MIVAQLRGAKFIPDDLNGMITFVIPDFSTRDIANDAVDDVSEWLGFSRNEYIEYLSKFGKKIMSKIKERIRDDSDKV